jgi:hypothetical protein
LRVQSIELSRAGHSRLQGCRTGSQRSPARAAAKHENMIDESECHREGSVTGTD